MTMLRTYDWPGNVRELANLIERLVVTRPNGSVDAEDLPWPINREPRQDPQIVDADSDVVDGYFFDL